MDYKELAKFGNTHLGKRIGAAIIILIMMLSNLSLLWGISFLLEQTP